MTNEKDDELLKFLMKHTGEEKEPSGSASGFLGVEHLEEKKKRRRKLAKEQEFEESVDEILSLEREREETINQLLKMMLKKTELDVDMKQQIKIYVNNLEEGFKDFYAKERKLIDGVKKTYQKKLKELDKKIDENIASAKKLQQANFELINQRRRYEQTCGIYNDKVDELNVLIRQYNDKIIKLNEQR